MKIVMKKLYDNCGVLVTFLFLTQLRQKTKDVEIKSELSSKSKSELSFAGVNYTVDKGLVTLTGICSSEKDRSGVESKAKKIAGVKKVINNIVVGAVVIGTDHGLKQSVDSVLKKHPKAQAGVKDSIVTLQGSAATNAISSIMSGVQYLRTKSIDNRLATK